MVSDNITYKYIVTRKLSRQSKKAPNKIKTVKTLQVRNSVAETKLDFSPNRKNHRTVVQDILLHSNESKRGWITFLEGKSVHYLLSLTSLHVRIAIHLTCNL